MIKDIIVFLSGCVFLLAAGLLILLCVSNDLWGLLDTTQYDVEKISDDLITTLFISLLIHELLSDNED